MIDLQAPSPATTLTALNETPVSQHVMTLFQQAKEPFSPSNLALVNLMLWAAENHYQDWHLGQQEAGAVVAAQEANPQAVHANLEDERMLEAQTLQQAAAVLVSRVAEMFPA